MTQKSEPLSLFVALFSIIVFVTYNYTLTMIAGTYIAGDLGGSHQIASYSTTFYALGNALTIPLGSFFIGRCRLAKAITSLLGFSALFSFLAYISPNYPYLLAMRVLQGAAVGPLFPMIFKTISTIGSKERKPHFVTLFLIIFTVVPTISACLGGTVAYEYQWRSLFLANVPIALLLGYALYAKLTPLEPTFTSSPIDHIGYLSFALGIAPLFLAITMGEELDWLRSPLITTFLITGSLSLLFFIFWELYHPHPVLELRLLKNRVFAFALLLLAILFSAYFGMVMLLSLWLNLTVHYTPYWIALIMGTMALAGLLPIFLILRGFHRIDCRIPLFLAIFFFFISCWHAMYFNEEINFGRIAISRAVAGFGLAIFLPPLFRLCFRTFSDEKGLSVVSFFQVTRILSTGLGASIYTTIWKRRQIFYHDRLGSKITQFSSQTRAYFERAAQFNLKGELSDAQLNQLLDRQAIALALEDCFYLMSWLMALLLIAILISAIARQKGFIPEELPH